MEKAKAVLIMYMNEKIVPYMEGNGLRCKVEYTGSSFQGLKVSDNKLDFDVVLEIEASNLMEKDIPGYPSHRELIPVDSKAAVMFSHYLDENGRMSGKKLAEKYFGHLQHLRNYDADIKRDVQFRKHGPAVQMDVKNENGSFWFSVDLVPCYKLQSRKSYVALPYKSIIKEKKVQDEAVAHAWYMSFSLDERDIFNAMDQDGGCRKAAVRVLKAMAQEDTALKGLSSYVYKTILLDELKENPGKRWSSDLLGTRVMDLLLRLQMALENHELKHFFIQDDNLLRNVRRITTENIFHRIKNLRNKEPKMLKLINGGLFNNRDEL